MKINLFDIAKIIEDITGITLKQLRSKLSTHEVAEARYLFLITAFEYGDYKNIGEITDFVNASKSSVNHARDQRYRKEIHNILMLIKPVLEEKSRDRKNTLKNLIPKLNNDDKILIANIIINQLPLHKRQYIIH